LIAFTVDGKAGPQGAFPFIPGKLEILGFSLEFNASVSSIAGRIGPPEIGQSRFIFSFPGFEGILRSDLNGPASCGTGVPDGKLEISAFDQGGDFLKVGSFFLSPGIRRPFAVGGRRPNSL
jgi:hypothetical protein